MNNDNHHYYIGQCLKQAKIGLKINEVPIGSLITINNKIIVKTYNQVETLKDPTAHAEILAISQACNKLQHKFLYDATIFISIEPCIMCYGAIKHARIKTLCFGAYEPKYGFTNFINTKQEKLNIIPNIMQDECSQILKDFFINKR